mmetsp:Transcript_18704/g.21275  ORF Transcript_18704/g.21275 Transcript_18704/m.21275 type:complete len:85 (-) Transcript_18704:101-355(-)
MAKELMQKTVHSGSKRSIIMDVSIDCHEMFQIKDTRTGKVIQGQGKSEGQEDDDDVDVDVDVLGLGLHQDHNPLGLGLGLDDSN